MKKTLILILAVLLSISFPLFALADTWICEKCYTENNSNFCCYCGAGRPVLNVKELFWESNRLVVYLDDFSEQSIYSTYAWEGMNLGDYPEDSFIGLSIVVDVWEKLEPKVHVKIELDGKTVIEEERQFNGDVAAAYDLNHLTVGTHSYKVLVEDVVLAEETFTISSGNDGYAEFKKNFTTQADLFVYNSATKEYTKVRKEIGNPNQLEKGQSFSLGLKVANNTLWSYEAEIACVLNDKELNYWYDYAWYDTAIPEMNWIYCDWDSVPYVEGTNEYVWYVNGMEVERGSFVISRDEEHKLSSNPRNDVPTLNANFSFMEGDYIYRLYSNGDAQLANYLGRESELVLPCEITTYDDELRATVVNPITEIFQSTFYNNTALRSVTIPEGVVNIRYAAFKDCSNLTSIVIPNSVANIEDMVFSGCEKLVIFCSEGSYAWYYAKQHNIPVVTDATPEEYQARLSTSKSGNVTLNIEKSEVFELSSSISMNKVRATVSWTDTANNSPYEVAYQVVGKDGVSHPSYWAGDNQSGSTTYAKSFTIDYLIPGRTYKIKITDCNGRTISRNYTIPSTSTFVDGKLKASSIDVSIQPRSKAYGASDSSASNISTLRASTIISNMNDKEYGIRYDIDYPQLAYSRTYFTQIVVIAPNGYSDCEIGRTVEYSKDYEGHYWYLLGDWTFKKIYEYNSVIPSGTWAVELYWDGMFVNRSTFNVQ